MKRVQPRLTLVRQVHFDRVVPGVQQARRKLVEQRLAKEWIRTGHRPARADRLAVHVHGKVAVRRRQVDSPQSTRLCVHMQSGLIPRTGRASQRRLEPLRDFDLLGPAEIGRLDRVTEPLRSLGYFERVQRGRPVDRIHHRDEGDGRQRHGDPITGSRTQCCRRRVEHEFFPCCPL